MLTPLHETYQKHGKEEDGPDKWSWESQNQFRVGQEHKSGSGPSHLLNSWVLNVGHVSKDGKDQDTGGQTCACVYYASDESIPEK